MPAVTPSVTPGTPAVTPAVTPTSKAYGNTSIKDHKKVYSFSVANALCVCLCRVCWKLMVKW